MPVTVYTITFNDQVKYIGITSSTLERREYLHKNEAAGIRSQYLIHKAMRKYPNSYKFNEFLSVFKWKDACELEKDLIKTFKTYVLNGGYNLTTGGEGNPGPYRSPEWRKKKSESQKSKKPAMLGKNHSEKTKKQISMSKIGVGNPKLKKPIIDELGNCYDSATDASRILGLKRTRIKEALRQNRPLNNGKQFFYLIKE